MKKSSIIVYIIILSLGIDSCSVKRNNEFLDRHYNGFNKVEIETITNDSMLNVRAMEIFNNDFGMYADSRGKVGIIGYEIKEEGQKKYYFTQEVHEYINDSIEINFRSFAKTSNIWNENNFSLSIGSPSLLYKNSTLVYHENHPKAFYDSMDFWNELEGIAIGDPTEDCMSIIISRDGGNTWTKLSCDDLPKTIEGEAAFAASDTNIAIVGDHTWVATGGKASRILYSANKGKTWEVFETPFIQGTQTTGMYSIDFYDEKNGFAIGGDYTKPNDTLNNKIRTVDGGKTWEVVANGKSPGYRSCVQYIPNSNGKELVAIGFKGIDYNNDGGDNWKHLSDEGFYTIRFVNDSVAYAAGKGRISKLTFRE